MRHHTDSPVERVESIARKYALEVCGSIYDPDFNRIFEEVYQKVLLEFTGNHTHQLILAASDQLVFATRP